jgi:hypothetical protein
MYSVENTVSYSMQNKYKNVRIINTTDEVECHIFTKIFYETVEISIYHKLLFGLRRCLSEHNYASARSF